MRFSLSLVSLGFSGVASCDFRSHFLSFFRYADRSVGDGGRKWSDHGELRFLSVGGFSFFFGFGAVWCGCGCGCGFLDMVSYRRLLATVEAAVLVGAKPEAQHRADLSHALHVSFPSFESFLKYPVSLLSVTLRKGKKMKKNKMGFPLLFRNF